MVVVVHFYNTSWGWCRGISGSSDSNGEGIIGDGSSSIRICSWGCGVRGKK